MSKVRRTFTTEFKIEAANLVLQQGYSITQACQSLGIGETALRRWITQLHQEQQGLTPEQRKIQEL